MRAPGVSFIFALISVGLGLCLGASDARACPDGAQSGVEDAGASAHQGITTVQGMLCDSGTPAGGNCTVAGLRVDASCAGLGPNLSRIVGGIRGVAGSGGLGCVGQMNPQLASDLNKVFSHNPPVAVCCGRCVGAGLPTQPVGNADCALTPPVKAGAADAVILNTRNIFSGGACGTLAMTYPGRAQLLHELLHVAGVLGAGGHGGSGTTDPETRQLLDERDFLADPVFGCQYSCYGKASQANSMRCLACADGSAVPSPFQSSPTRLEQALRELEAKADAHDASVPARCQARWDSAGDPGRASYRAYAAGLAALQKAEPALQSCLTDRMGDSPMGVTSLREYAGRCAREVQAMRDACNGFGRASGCRNSAGLDSSSIASRCRDAISSYESKVTGLVRAFGAVGRSRMASRFEGFRCEDYFATETACGSDPQLLSACRSILDGAKP